MPSTAQPSQPAARPARRLVIIGAVAAGTSVGAKARRNDEELEIVVHDRDRDISYSGCGLPYDVRGQVADADELHPRDAAWFAKRYNMDIRTGHEVISVDHPTRTIRVVDLATGTEATGTYDTLVPLGVFTVRNVQNADSGRCCFLARGGAHLQELRKNSREYDRAGFDSRTLGG